MGFYCKYADYVFADWRQGVSLHVGVGAVFDRGLSTCRHKNSACYEVLQEDMQPERDKNMSMTYME